MSLLEKVEKSKRAQKVLNSSATLLVLSILVPIFFMISINLHMFNAKQVSGTLLVSLLVSVPISLIGVFFDICIKRFKILFSISYISSILTMIIALISFIIIFQLIVPVSDWFNSKSARDIFRGIIYVGVAIIAYKYTLKPLNIFLFIFLIITIVRFPLEVYKYSDDFFAGSYNHSEELVNKTIESALSKTDDFSQISLKEKPNIYLFLLESYVDINTLKNTFKVDTQILERKLNDMNFIIYEDIYSNNNMTTSSLVTLVTMDFPHAPNKVLTGTVDNLLYAYLKKEGYITRYLYRSKITKAETGILLDIANPDIENDIMYVFTTISIRLANFIYKYFNIPSGLEYNFIEIIQSSIIDIASSNKPNFLHFKITDKLHVNPNGIAKTFELEKPRYNANFLDVNENELFPLLSFIENYDPNAVIILIGDHGFRYTLDTINPRTYSLKNTPETIIKEHNLSFTPQDIIDDNYSTFLAVKMPDYAKQDISFGYKISHVNLFRHVFSAINDDSTFLNNRKENFSFLADRETIVAKDGKVILEEENLEE